VADRTDIIEKIKTYLQEDILQLPNREIESDEALISSGLIDSFSLVDVALFVEDVFNVHIADTELNADTFDTLNELAELVVERQGG
jgi:acyl carrier protein